MTVHDIKIDKIRNYHVMQGIFESSILIVSPSTIDKMFEIYTFFENTTEICNFFENRTEFYTFFENRFEIYTHILFENRTEISNILSMVDGLTISTKNLLFLESDDFLQGPFAAKCNGQKMK